MSLLVRRSSLILAGIVVTTLVGLARGFWGDNGKVAALLIDVALLMGVLQVSFGNDLKPHAIRIPLVLLVIWLSVRLFDSNTPSVEVAFYGARKTLYFFLAVLVGLSSRLPSFPRIGSALLLVMALQSVFAIEQRFMWSDFDARLVESTSADFYTGLLGGERRSVGLFSSPFSLGMLGALGVALAPSFRGWRGLASLVLGGGLVWLSMTRINFVAAPIALSVALLTRRNTVRKWALPGAPLGLIFLICTGLVFIEQISGLLRSDSRLDGRFEGYSYVAKELFASPARALFGYGLGSAGDTLAPYYLGGVHVTSHNLFVKIAFEAGLVGFLILCWFLGAALKSALRSKSVPPNVVLGVFTVLLVNGMTGSAIESIPVSIFVGILIGMGARSTSSLGGAERTRSGVSCGQA